MRASLPAPEFTLAWTHSVQKTRWEERYRADGDALRLVEARVEGSGAGMEPAASAVLRDGAWVWQPGTVIPELRVTRSAHAGDYAVCWGGSCRGLSTLVGPTEDGAVVSIRPCRPGERTR